MSLKIFTGAALAIALVSGCATSATHRANPAEWIDAATGHRFVQLSREPGSESLYFNLNPFTPDGKKMVFTAPSGIAMVNLQTREVETIVAGGNLHVIMVGRRTGKIYFSSTNRTVFAVDPQTKIIRPVATLANGQQVAAINADETLLAGTITEQADEKEHATASPRHQSDIARADAQRGKKGALMEQRLARHIPMALFFHNLATGETVTCNRCTDWLGHLQFSPTDPHLLMFCHEGPWHKVDRIWTIRSDGSDLQLIHRRTLVMEIAGHEFFSADGKNIWYDLQTPRGENFWVAGWEISTGERTWYHLQRDEWGVHFNVSPDGQLFSSDGGDDKMVAHATDGKWLYLLHPEKLADRSEGNVDTSRLIRTGVFHAEKLVNMAKHDYALEPNAMFSPDMKWLIFRSNMSGANQVYAVELAKPEKN